RSETTIFGVSSSNEETTPETIMLFVLPLLAAVTLAGQSPDHASRPADARPRQAGTKSVTATRAAQPPTIDGRDDDAVWREAPPIREFEEWRPNRAGRPNSASRCHSCRMGGSAATPSA